MLGGCASTIPASTPTTYYGQDAAVIASLIPDCTGVKSGDVGAGGPSLTSTATCQLGGHSINVNGWSDPNSNDLRPLLKVSGDEIYYASGTGWTVTLGDDPTLQMQLENDAAGLLKQAGDSAVPNLDAEKTMAKTVADALQGEVVHVKP